MISVRSLSVHDFEYRMKGFECVSINLIRLRSLYTKNSIAALIHFKRRLFKELSEESIYYYYCKSSQGSIIHRYLKALLVINNLSGFLCCLTEALKVIFSTSLDRNQISHNRYTKNKVPLLHRYYLCFHSLSYKSNG